MGDFCNGNIFVKEVEFKIHPNLNIKDLINSQFYTDFLLNHQDYINGYSWFYFKPVTILEHLMGINLCFKEKRIFLVLLYLHKDEKFQKWENWSEEHELFRKAEHDKILEGELTKKPDFIQSLPFQAVAYDFGWGQISSEYDTKSASSYISFRYL